MPVDQRQRHLLRAERPEILQGHLAIINMGIAFAKSQIRPGLQYFTDLDTSLANFEESDDDVGDDEEVDEDANSDCEESVPSTDDNEFATLYF